MNTSPNDGITAGDTMPHTIGVFYSFASGWRTYPDQLPAAAVLQVWLTDPK